MPRIFFVSIIQIKVFSYCVCVSQNIEAADATQFQLFVEAEDREESSLQLGASEPVIKWRNSF